MAIRIPASQLRTLLLPTFGRPTMTTCGTAMGANSEGHAAGETFYDSRLRGMGVAKEPAWRKSPRLCRETNQAGGRSTSSPGRAGGFYRGRPTLLSCGPYTRRGRYSHGGPHGRLI